MLKEKKSVLIKGREVDMDKHVKATLVQFARAVKRLQFQCEKVNGVFGGMEKLKKYLSKVDLEIDHSHEANTEFTYNDFGETTLYIRIKDSSNKWRRPDNGTIWIDILIDTDENGEISASTNSMSGIENVPDVIKARIAKTIEYITKNAPVWIPKIEQITSLLELNLTHYEFFGGEFGTALDAGIDELAKTWDATSLSEFEKKMAQ